MYGIELRLDAFKASDLPAVLSLQPGSSDTLQEIGLFLYSEHLTGGGGVCTY